MTFIGVLGVGRCGSSAVAGMLHVGGVPMGQTLVGPHARYNARGHYEDRTWHRLNRLVAYRCCGPAVQDGIRNETLVRYADFVREPGCDVLMARYAEKVSAYKRPIWGMKCIMLGLIWPQVHEFFGGDVRLIVVDRARDDVVRSRMEHSGIVRAEAEALVDTLQAGIDGALRLHTGPVLKLQYEYVVQDPKSIAYLLSSFTGLEGFDQEAATQHVDPKLDHAKERVLA